MAAFEFSLQKVLKVRNIREEHSQNQFLKAKKEENKIKTELKNICSQQQKLYNFIRSNKLSTEESLRARSFMSLKRQKINTVQEKLKSQKKEVSSKKENYIKKKKKRQVLEKIKEKEYKLFYDNYLKCEQKELDDIALCSSHDTGEQR